MKLIATLACLLSALTAHAQGPLTPPGAPAPGMRSLIQVEPRIPITNVPFTISASGSYYLTQNFVNNSADSAITINASDVTVDMMGFRLSGPDVGPAKAIEQAPGFHRATVRNGHINLFPGGGISLGDHSAVENIMLSDVAGAGIVVGTYSRVHAVQVHRAGALGVSIGSYSRLTDSVVSHTLGGGSGVVAGPGALVSGCIAVSNALYGFHFTGHGMIRESSADENGVDGIFGDQDLVVTTSRVYGNANRGINIVTGGVVRDNVTSGNAVRGIRVGHNSVVDNNITFTDAIDGAGTNIVTRNLVRGGPGHKFSNSLSTLQGIGVFQSQDLLQTERPFSNIIQN